jgi:ubiquinone/menaquinone biosynthesis C-methylase UbiE
MTALNGFDAIAKIYDMLARIVFGRSIRAAQLYFIDQIPNDANILILGGGTGWILKAILEIKPASRIWYVEASSKMISLSWEKTKENNNIYFIHGTENDIPTNQNYNVVITNFYLDLFTDEMLPKVINKILPRLEKDYLWIATDFVNEGKPWQDVLLKFMYSFFRVIARINSQQLPDWSMRLEKGGLCLKDSKCFYSGFIKTSLFKATHV